MNTQQIQNLEMLKELEKKLQMLRKNNVISECRFGINCIRKFCKFDHSFIFRKVNNQTFHEGENTFATKENLANHTGKHKEHGMKKQPEIGLNRIENAPQEEENVASEDLSIDDNLKQNIKLSEHFFVDEGDENSTTETESGESEEISQSSEKLSISSGGNVTDQSSD